MARGVLVISKKGAYLRDKSLMTRELIKSSTLVKLMPFPLVIILKTTIIRAVTATAMRRRTFFV